MRREGIVGAAALSALVLFAPACPLEAGPAVVPAPRSTRYTIRKAREPAREIARQDGLVAWAPDARELELARGLLREARERRQGDGSGGDVANAVAIQVAYSDPEVGNVVLLIWEENRSNKPNVKIFVNGQLFATAPGLPDAELDDNGDGKVDDQDTQGDDANAIFIGPFPAGAYSFRVEGGGTEALADLVVVAEQPFADASEPTCREGGRDPATGLCSVDLSWKVAGTEPTFFFVLLDGDPLGTIDGSRRDVTITDVGPGTYTVTLLGFLENDDGIYRGGFVDVTCTVDCVDEPCEPPSGLFVCQVAYGVEPAMNALRAEWINGESPYPVGVIGLIDGAEAGTLPGDSQEAIFSGMAPGEHTIGVQGDCGAPDGKSAIASDTFVVLEATPHPNPVAGEVVCTYNAETSETTATWTNADPSTFIAVFVRAGAEAFFLGFIAGDSTTVAVGPTQPTESIELQFFAFVEGDCYGSAFIGCAPPQEQCDPPAGLLLCQVAYSSTAGENVVRAEWANGEASYAAGIVRHLDGAEAGTLPGDAEVDLVDKLAAGEHTIGVQGDCGDPLGRSAITSGVFNVLDATPHTRPVDGDVVCTFNAETSETTARWTNADPSIAIGVLVRSGAATELVGFIPGDSTSVTVGPTTAADVIVLQFFADVGGFCYASELVACVSGKRYVQGLCNGAGEKPQITSAIYGLAFLFTGGAAPPCTKACDANGDGRFDLSDMVYILSYLFLGGPAPPLWEDPDQDGIKDPSCTPAAEGDDCETSHEACGA